MSQPSPRPNSLVPGAARAEDGSDASADAGLVTLVGEAKRVDLALRALLARDRRDTGEISGFDDLADALSALVARACEARASGLAGLVAKASLSAHLSRDDGDRGARLAVSVVRDILALSGGLPA